MHEEKDGNKALMGGGKVWREGRQHILIRVKYSKLTFLKTTNALTPTTHTETTHTIIEHVNSQHALH